jgi:hypothetical protein
MAGDDVQEGVTMVDVTSAERAPSVPDADPRSSVDRGRNRGLALVVAWHVAGAVASVAMMLLASRRGDNELPGAIGVFLRVFAAASFAAHAGAAFGVTQRRSWGRTVSLVVSYLVFVVAVVAVIHQLGGFTAIGALGEGLSKAVVPFVVVAVGLLWVLVAGQIGASRPAAPGPRQLRTAGWLVAGIGSVWFVIAADPSGMVSTVLDRIVQPVTIATVLLSAASFAATRFMWSRDIGRLFGTTASVERTLTGLAFLSPNLLGFLFFFAGPVLFSLVVSFYDWRTTGTGRSFVGIENYIQALSLDFASASGPGAGVEVLKAATRC